MEMTKEDYLEALAKRIKTLRKQQGMTQSQLAEKLGTNHTYIVRMEKGGQDSQISSLLAIANALDVTITELVTVG